MEMLHDTLVEGRRERKKRELRAHIYHSARRLFVQHGFEATTVEQIAAAADIAPATFFNHFQSKVGLLGEMTSEVFAHMGALIDQWLMCPGSTRERITTFVDRAAHEIEQSRNLAHDVLLELMRTRARPGEAVPYLAHVHESFAAIIREGQSRAEVRNDLQAEFLAEMVVGALNATVITWINDPYYPLEQRLRETAAFISGAIEPRAV